MTVASALTEDAAEIIESSIIVAWLEGFDRWTEVICFW